MKSHVSPKQVARAINASEASLKRWCDKGFLHCTKTAGGHRRIAIDSVIHFLRRSGRHLVRPEILGLPCTAGCHKFALEQALGPIRDALETGDEEKFRRIAMDLYLCGSGICEICDEALAPAFHGMGECWESGKLEVFQERRACEMCAALLYELRFAIPPAGHDAPYALGGALYEDNYSIPSSMAALVLREAGWRADSYGTGLPVATLCAAVREKKPRLVWLSVSTIPAADRFIADLSNLHQAVGEAGAALVVGGRALTECVRKRMKYSAYCDQMRHLVSFAEGIYRQPAERTTESVGKSADAGGGRLAIEPGTLIAASTRGRRVGANRKSIAAVSLSGGSDA